MASKASAALRVSLAFSAVIFVSLVLLTAINAGPAATEVPRSRILISDVQSQGSDFADVIVVFKDGVDIAPEGLSSTIFSAELSGLKLRGLAVEQELPIIHGIRATVPSSQLEALRESPAVELVELNELKYHTLLDSSVPVINADDAQALGYNGTGVKVCILDTGIDFFHTNLPAPSASKDFTTWDWCMDGDERLSVSGTSRAYNYSLNFTNTSIDWLQMSIAWGSSGNRYDLYVYYPDGSLANATTQDVINELWENASNVTNFTLAHTLIVPSSVVVKNGTDTLDSSNYTVFATDGKIILTEPSFVGENLTVNYTWRIATFDDTLNSGLFHAIINITNTTLNPGVWTIVANETNITVSSDYLTIFWGANVTTVATYYDLTFRCGTTPGPIGTEPRTFINDHPQDDHGHGTHVAGTVASNNTTYFGVAPGSTLLIGKVLDTNGQGTTTSIVNGINWCVENDADIISMSLGGTDTANCGTSDVLAVDNATKLGVLSVIAAGNSGPGSTTIAEPGCSRTALTVGATEDDDDIASFSSRGPTSGTAPKRTKPDVVAPGVSVVSLFPTNSVKSQSGTSMSTPHVAGVAAMLKQKNSSLGPAELKAMIMASSNKTELFVDQGDFDPNNKFGAGRVDALRAVNGTFVRTFNISSGQTVTFKINVTDSSRSLFAAAAWVENNTDTHNNITLNLTKPDGTVNDTSTHNNNTIQQVGSLTEVGVWTLFVKSLSGVANKSVSVAATYPLEQPPVINLRAPANNNKTNISAINFSYQVSDPNSIGISTCGLYGNFTGTFELNQTNATAVVANGTTLNNFTLGLADGVYIWNVFCNNTLSETGFNSTNFTLTVDTTAPLITLNSPVPLFNTSGNITLNWSVTDLTLSRVKYSLNGAANVSDSAWNTNASGAINVTVNAGLNQNITFFANDSFGKTNSTTVFFNIDRTAPNLTLLSPANGSIFSTNTTDLNWTATDNLALDTVYYVFEGEPNVTITDNTTLDLPFPGEYELDLFANDTVGNLNQTSSSFIAEFPMNMTNWSTIQLTDAPEINELEVFLGALDVTTNDSTSVNGTMNMTARTANFNVSFTSFNGLQANWIANFNMTETSTDVSDVITAIGSEASLLIQVTGANAFLSDEEYNATVTFPGNLENYTEFYYCEPETISETDDCTRLSACSGPFNGTACFNESVDSTTVFAPHLSAVVAANDTTAPTITINSPANTTFTNSNPVFDLKANLTTSADSIYCNMSLLGNSGNSTDDKTNSTTTSGSASYVWQIGPLHNAKYNITFNCNDTAGNTNTSIRYFTVNDTTLPTFIDVNETTIAKTFFRVHWEANEPVNATIRYGTTLSLNSNVTNSTFANETTQQISGLNDDTEYFWNFTGCDYMGNCRTVGPFNVTTLLNESSGSNEPGEGGGGGTVSNQTNQTSKTQLWAMLEAGSTTTMNIDSPNIPVTGIEFRIASDVENGQITVRGLGNTPPAGLPAPPDTVYQFFSIDATSNLDAALTSATITFTVPSSYFTQNNQNASTARLYNSNATHWEMLGTVRDGNTYEATTTHFSFFAITSKPNEGVVLPSGNETVPNETTELPSDELEDVFVPPSAGPLELPLDYVIYIVIMSVGIAVVAVLIYLVKTERIHLKLPKPKEKPGKPLPQKQQDYLRIKKLNKRRPPRGEGPGIFKLE